MPKLKNKASGKHYHEMVAWKAARRPTDAEVFVENSPHRRGNLKRRILRGKLIPYQCAECRLEGMWNGKKLTLPLDHKNGINNDSRIENLRFLCPNCHSQQPTFAGRNRHKVGSGIWVKTYKTAAERKLLESLTSGVIEAQEPLKLLDSGQIRGGRPSNRAKV